MELRPHEDTQRDQINSAAELPPEPMPSLPEHETVNKAARSVDEVEIPEGPEFEDEQFEDEDGALTVEASLETPVRVVPQAVVYFRAQEDSLQQILLQVRKHESEEHGVLDLCNPLASGKRRGNKPAGTAGLLREPVAEFFKFLGTVINQNAVFIGEKSQLDQYLDRLFQRVEHRMAELLYGDEPMLIGEDYSIDKMDMFACDLSLTIEQGEEIATAYVTISINIHVAQLLAAIERAESVLKNYMKYLTTAFASAGVSGVSAGVVFDVEDFSNPNCTAFNLFNLLVGNGLATKAAEVISKHSAKGAEHEFAFQGSAGGNVLVMLSSETESENQEV